MLPVRLATSRSSSGSRTRALLTSMGCVRKQGNFPYAGRGSGNFSNHKKCTPLRQGAAGRENRKRACLPFAHNLAGNQKTGEDHSGSAVPSPERVKLIKVLLIANPHRCVFRQAKAEDSEEFCSGGREDEMFEVGLSWLRKISTRFTGIRTRTAGFGFPDAPGARKSGIASAPLAYPLKLKKTYHGK